MPKTKIPKAESILVSLNKVKGGPPPPHARWNFESLCALLRGAKIDVERVVNWTKAPNGAGYIIYFHGEAPTELARLKLL